MRKYLVQLREQHSMSQQDVAQKLNITRQYYQQIEAGIRQKRPDAALLSSLGEIFGLTIVDMMELEDSEQDATA